MDLAKKRHIETTVQGFVIVTALMALIFIGSASVNIVVSNAGREADTDVQRSDVQFFSNAVIPDDDGSMEKNEPASSAKSIFLTLQAVLGGHNFSNSRTAAKGFESRAFQSFNSCHFHVLTTMAAMSPKKANEFTLLGAKPSGTS